MYKVGLIILNYNSADDTISCVKKLNSFNKEYQIIVVDNCSTDNSLDMIRSELKEISHVDIICNKRNAGYSAGNNYGMKYAIDKYGVEIIGVLNPDVIILDENFIQNICVALMSNKDYAVAGGVALNAEREYNINFSCWNIPTSGEVVRNHFLLNKRQAKNRNLKMLGENFAETECVAGCFFLAKTDAIKKLGFLDENVFLYNEENILGIKCKNEGYKEIIVLDQFYIHNHKYKKKEKTTFKKKILMTRNGYESRKYMCSTYYKKSLLPMLFIVEMANRIYLMGCYLKNLVVRERKQ